MVLRLLLLEPSTFESEEREPKKSGLELGSGSDEKAGNGTAGTSAGSRGYGMGPPAGYDSRGGSWATDGEDASDASAREALSAIAVTFVSPVSAVSGAGSGADAEVLAYTSEGVREGYGGSGGVRKGGSNRAGRGRG